MLPCPACVWPTDGGSLTGCQLCAESGFLCAESGFPMGFGQHTGFPRHLEAIPCPPRSPTRPNSQGITHIPSLWAQSCDT